MKFKKFLKIIANNQLRFKRIRPVAPICPPVSAHWRHLANTIELVLPSASLIPQHKWQTD